MVKKYQIALFLNKSKTETQEWFRIKKSTELTISMNAETETFDFIADENPSTELKQYAPSIDQDLTMFESEEDYKFVFNKFFEQATGTDAHVDCMIVFMMEGNAESGYKAWKTDSMLSIDNLNAVDGKINFKINFNGTTEKGTAAVTGKAPDYVPTFTAATE